MPETTMSMEPPKKGLKEGLRRAFTVSGAKEKWYQDHKEMVAKYADVHNGLTDEQRSAVMSQIESDATKSAKIAVGKRVGALATVTAVAGFAGGLVGSEKFRAVVSKGGPIGKWLAERGQMGAFGLEVAKGAAMEKGGQALTFIKSIPEKAGNMWANFRAPKPVAA